MWFVPQGPAHIQWPLHKRLCQKFLGDALRCRCRDLAKRSVYLVGCAFALTFELALLLVVLRQKKWFGSSPFFSHGLSPVVNKLGFKNVSEIHLRHKVINFVVVCDGNHVFGAFNLSPIELSGEGCDVVVWSITPRRKKYRLHIELLFVRDDEPFLEERDHSCDRLVVVSNVVFREFLNIMFVNSSDDGFNANRIQYGLEYLFLPFHLVLLL